VSEPLEFRILGPFEVGRDGDALVVDAERIPGRLGHEHAVAELPAEPGDVPLHILRGGSGRLIALTTFGSL